MGIKITLFQTTIPSDQEDVQDDKLYRNLREIPLRISSDGDDRKEAKVKTQIRRGDLTHYKARGFFHVSSPFNFLS